MIWDSPIQPTRMKAADQGKYGQVQQNPQGNYNFPGDPSNSSRALVDNWALTDKVEEKEKTRAQNTHTIYKAKQQLQPAFVVWDG